MIFLAQTPQTNIRLKKDEREALDKIAKKNRTNRTEQIRQWLRDNTEDSGTRYGKDTLSGTGMLMMFYENRFTL